MGLLAQSSSCKGSLPGFLYKGILGSEPGEAVREGPPVRNTGAWQPLGRCYLDVSVQQLLCEVLQRHGRILGAVRLPVERRDVGSVTGERFGVKVLKGFEVIVDGMSHHYLPCEYLQDLKSMWKRW